MSFGMTDEFSVRVAKITSRIVCFLPIFNSMLKMTILSKGLKTDNLETTLKLNFTNIQSLC